MADARSILWGRSVVVAFCVSFIPNLFGFLQAITMPLMWQYLGTTMPDAWHQGLVIRRIAIVLSVALAYVLFLTRLPGRRMAHAVVVFAAAEAFSYGGSVLLVLLISRLAPDDALPFGGLSPVHLSTHLLIALGAAAAATWLKGRRVGD
jgi:hypothetical protein